MAKQEKPYLVGIRLYGQQHRRIKSLARRRRVSAAEIVRRAIESFEA